VADEETATRQEDEIPVASRASPASRLRRKVHWGWSHQSPALAGSVQFQKKKISCKESFEEAFSSFGEAGASAWSKLVNGQGFCALATPMSCYYPVIGRNLIS